MLISAKKLKRFSVYLLILSVSFTQSLLAQEFQGPGQPMLIRYQEPDFLTFEELKTLSQHSVPRGSLVQKLPKFWTTPIINNEAFYKGVSTTPGIHSILGPSMRLVSWNIEKSIRIDDAIAAFSSDAQFRGLIDTSKTPEGSKQYQQVLEQRKKLASADVIVLQEMEIGVKRSGYKNAAAELAKALNMNFAYAPQYLEIDPVLLGTSKVTFNDGQIDKEVTDYFAVDPEKYRGVFGSAILSRYPIKHVEVFPLKTQPYDWYWGEKQKTAFLEKSRRFGSKKAFKNEMTRELKVGGRHFFRVDLDVPELSEGTLTIINIHLEIKCRPEDRAAQVEEILSYIKHIKHPVIMLGDFNSAGTDLSPTSLPRAAGRQLKNPTNWLSAGVTAVVPQATAVNATRAVSNLTKNFQDPTSKDIPVIAPNKVSPMFKSIETFSFSDGGVFDFRGDKNQSVNGKKGTLANSNQRDLKGFKTTFSVRRPLVAGLIGKYRLDWIFVKSYLKHDPRSEAGPYKFAPHFGETLEEMNTSLLSPISDHHPNIVDLPFKEPALGAGGNPIPTRYHLPES